jgi:hypothetical protein
LSALPTASPVSRRKLEQRIQALQELDRRKCADDPVRFVERHCTIEEPDGTVIPFTLWPFQRPVLQALRAGDPVIVLKARRLGLSWVVLSFALWLAIFQQGVRILVLCKTEADATELLDRIRRMLDRIRSAPRSAHILAGLEKPAKERDAVTTLDVGSSTIRALVGTPAAARSETAGLVIADEFAFQKRAPAIWQALLPTVEGGGHLAIVSTGNGRSGDGEQYARLWQQARTVEGWAPFFFPWQVRPDRDEQWKQRQLDLLGDPEKFRVEYPEVEDDAFHSPDTHLVYSPAGIDAAVTLGTALDADCPPPDGGELLLGLDWGEHTHCLLLHPLVGGGVFVRDELVFEGTEPGAASERMIAMLQAAVLATEGASPGSVEYDAAGAQPARTLKAVRNQRMESLGTHAVAFGKHKDDTVGYLRRLFNRTAAGRDLGVVAISPRCDTLIKQLRDLQFRDADQGKVLKHNDHGPDALVAGMARIARRHRDLIEQDTT